jgi:hypothetical protein
MATKHYFVVGSSGASIHLKGPFASREAARAFVDRYRANAPCWLVPAEYFGVIDHTPLNENGEKSKEGQS